MKNLSQYLRFEAMDKKGIENPSSPETMAALVRQTPISTTYMRAHWTVQVPTQDNYCDCGLYLLHFAKVFMEDPVKSFHTIIVSHFRSITPLHRSRPLFHRQSGEPQRQTEMLTGRRNWSALPGRTSPRESFGSAKRGSTNELRRRKRRRRLGRGRVPPSLSRLLSIPLRMKIPNSRLRKFFRQS